METLFNFCLCALLCTTSVPVDNRDKEKTEFIFYKEALLPKEIVLVDDDSVPDEVDD